LVCASSIFIAEDGHAEGMKNAVGTESDQGVSIISMDDQSAAAALRARQRAAWRFAPDGQRTEAANMAACLEE
jgi:hypothetical protein